MKKVDKKQLSYLILSVLWGSFIFYLSSIPNLSTGFPVFFDLFIRKLLHIFVFFVLAYLVSETIHKTRKLHLSFIILSTIYYAFMDEIHQATVDTRDGNYVDILVDSIGIFLGILLYKHITKKLPK